MFLLQIPQYSGKEVEKTKRRETVTKGYAFQANATRASVIEKAPVFSYQRETIIFIQISLIESKFYAVLFSLSNRRLDSFFFSINLVQLIGKYLTTSSLYIFEEQSNLRAQVKS